MTPRQEAILAHVVKNPQAWYDHAVEDFGKQLADEFLVQKCRRYEAEYDRESKRVDYKTRNEREQIEKARQVIEAAKKE